MGAFLLIAAGLILFSGAAWLFSVVSDPERVDKEEARRVGNR